METNKIEVLLRAVELGSLSKAAEEYSYTPSAVSHIADSVESEIGRKLLKRTHSGVEIEENALEIVEKLKKIIEIKNEICDHECHSNTLTVGTYASLSKSILPHIIKEYKNKFSSTDIHIIVDDKMSDVYENSDILIGEKLDAESLAWEELFTEHFYAVCPQRHKILSGVFRKEDYSDSVFIMPNDRKIGKYLSDVPVGNIINIDSHDDSSVIQMVKEGIGFSILPALSVEGADGVNCFRLEPPLTRTIGIMYEKKKSNKMLRNFIEFLKYHIQ